MPGIDVVALRRDLHRHPELAYAEHRTTGVIVDQLRHLGLAPKVLPSGTGVVCDVPALTSTDAAVVALRADIDALPVSDLKEVPYRSVHDGVCHGCGHDAHTAILLGAAAELVSEPVAATVRLLFQPAEETVPGGAVSVLSDGVLDGVSQIYALHCDPRIETGRVGLRVGPITAACDHVEVTLSGPGGHTARPHLTSDVVYAAGLLITELPGVLSRRVDPRAALSLVWGAVQAGHAANAIPTTGALRGTVRVLDADAWDGAEDLVASLVEQLVAATGVAVRISYVRGVPPVVNHPAAVQVQKAAVTAALGAEAVTDTAQSMGGEDFAWYLRAIPGALARLGVRAPGTAPFDLHQGTFDIDEAALQVGVRYTVALAAAAAGRSLTQ